MKELSVKLNETLASLNVFYNKLRNLHWNVDGPRFYELHEYYESLYNAVNDEVDEVAETILMIGQTPVSTVKEHLELSLIKEVSVEDAKGEKGLAIVLKDLETLLNNFNEVLELADEKNSVLVNDLMTGLIVKYHKAIWMLKSTITK